jgi:mannosyl-3-phosphoglycerate phosphatase
LRLRPDRRQPPAGRWNAADRVILFSDPDTLRDGDTTASSATREAIAALEDHGVAVVLWGNETRSEIELIQSDLNLRHPFVSENGGGLFIPYGYFPHIPDDAEAAWNYRVVGFGRPYHEITADLHATARKLGIDIVAFNDMSVQDVADACDLSLAQARLAKLREYDEPFRILSSDRSAYARICHALRRFGIRCFTHETFHHASSVTDGARSLRLLASLYRNAGGRVLTIGIAKDPSEAILLQSVDVPLAIRGDETDAARLCRKVPAARLIDAAAWRQTVLQLADGGPEAWAIR